MHSYFIYTGISHVNQLTKLHPGLIAKIRNEISDIAQRFGGRTADTDLFVFPPSLGETARKAAEAAHAMYRVLRENDRDLYGMSVLVYVSDGEKTGLSERELDSLLLTVPDENGFWVAPRAEEDFRPYVEGVIEEGLFRVLNLKEAGLRLEERLPRLLVRSSCLDSIVLAIESIDRKAEEGGADTALVLRGCPGAGKRASLQAALHKVYPDDGGAPMVIPFAEDSEDPMEPFLRTPGSFIAGVSEYLDDDERQWWENEGFSFLEKARNGGIGDAARDQGPVDLIQAFALYLKAHVERQRRGGRPAYLIIDGFRSDSEATAWLASLLKEFKGIDSFRLILIMDTDVPEESVLLPIASRELYFDPPDMSEWTSMVEAIAEKSLFSSGKLKRLSEGCGADIQKAFHYILARERSLGSGDPGEALVSSLDDGTKALLFLVHAASGLVSRNLLSERLGTSEDKVAAENARFDGLLDLGLIRTDPDGRVRPISGGPSNAHIQSPTHLRDAEKFGEYLYRRYTDGTALDLFRLFRYLEKWGPISRAVSVLDKLLEHLLTNRRLRAAGLLLNGPIMSASEPDGPDVEALQNVIGAARLRYVLLMGDSEKAHGMVRDGTITLIASRGAYADRFRLHQARFAYAMGRYEESLAASKEALFSFQKIGNHEGETHSHLELALSLMALGKVRDSLEHFGIARRIGMQVNASWGVLRAGTMEAVGQFLFGNLPRSGRECLDLRQLAHKAGRRDLWLLLTLVSVRINWELGRYAEAAVQAEEGRRTARFYGLEDETAVMHLWKGRSLLAQGSDEGRTILVDAGSCREAKAFLAEDAWWRGRLDEALTLIGQAKEIPRNNRKIQGEADDWTDGFYPIEGRLADNDGPLDVLEEWIEAFEAFLAAKSGKSGAQERLASLLDKDVRRGPRPFSYQYAQWTAAVSGGESMEQQTRYMSRAFNDLQARAGRFDDAQTKHAWLSANPWNKNLMGEAQRLKFL